MDAVKNLKKNVSIGILGGIIGASVVYILSTNIIAGIVPNNLLANSNAPFGLAFATMFTPVVGKIIAALMAVSCFGPLLGRQFTTVQVFKTSPIDGYFSKIFSKITKSETAVVG